MAAVMQPSMPTIDLVDDVKLIVLEHLSHPSDLHALCTVSRGWKHIATTHLYKHISVNIGLRNSQLARFEECMYRGALNNLRCTQSLVLYDVACSSEVSAYDEQRSLAKEFETVRQEDILRVLHLFPDNRLSSFRYSSRFKFPVTCLEYLNKYQVSIKDMHVAGSDPLLIISPSKRNITAYFDTESKSQVFVQFAKSVKPLESLSISLPGGWSRYDGHYWEHVVGPLEDHRMSTKSVTITGCMPRSFGDKVHHLFNWSMLTCLNLFDGNIWLLQDIVANVWSTPELCNLVRFQCYTSDHIFENDTRILQHFFERNESLRHIMLSISGLSRLPMGPTEQLGLDGPTLATDFILWPLRSQLQTLVWHNPSQAHRPTQITPLSVSSLEFICQNFPQLQEFGFIAPQNFTQFMDKEDMKTIWREDLLRYLGPLSHLKKLKMVHLYQDYFESEDRSDRFWTQRQTTFEIQNFATTLFQWTHTHCPQLEVLAWGLYGEASDFEKPHPWDPAGDASRFVPELFFVKRVRYSKDYKMHITASFTTRSRLRADFPDLLLPTCDPGFDELERNAFGCPV